MKIALGLFCYILGLAFFCGSFPAEDASTYLLLGWLCWGLGVGFTIWDMLDD